MPLLPISVNNNYAKNALLRRAILAVAQRCPLIYWVFERRRRLLVVLFRATRTLVTAALAAALMGFSGPYQYEPFRPFMIHDKLQSSMNSSLPAPTVDFSTRCVPSVPSCAVIAEGGDWILTATAGSDGLVRKAFLSSVHDLDRIAETGSSLVATFAPELTRAELIDATSRLAELSADELPSFAISAGGIDVALVRLVFGPNEEGVGIEILRTE